MWVSTLDFIQLISGQRLPFCLIFHIFPVRFESIILHSRRDRVIQTESYYTIITLPYKDLLVFFISFLPTFNLKSSYISNAFWSKLVVKKNAVQIKKDICYILLFLLVQIYFSSCILSLFSSTLSPQCPHPLLHTHVCTFWWPSWALFSVLVVQPAYEQGLWSI